MIRNLEESYRVKLKQAFLDKFTKRNAEAKKEEEVAVKKHKTSKSIEVLRRITNNLGRNSKFQKDMKQIDITKFREPYKYDHMSQKMADKFKLNLHIKKKEAKSAPREEGMNIVIENVLDISLESER